MARYCFILRVRPDRLEAYRAAHAAVPEPMLRAIADSGWSNYSIFADDSGLVIGYVEADDFDASRALISASPARAEWDALIGEFFEPEPMRLVPLAFNLERQLRR